MGKHKTAPETAYIKDEHGFWPVDMEDAFKNYRNKKGYLYHGPIHMNGEVAHIFYSNLVYE